MSPLLHWFGSRRVLVVVAAPAEIRAVAAGLNQPDPTSSPTPPTPRTDWPILLSAGPFDLVASGVGKTNAAAATARHLDPARYAAALSLGIAGALPGSPSQLGQVVLATASAYADEGLLTDDGFRDLAQMGFPPGGSAFPACAVPANSDLARLLAPLADHQGVIATVSTCSGTNALARAVVDRTSAIAEAMEGAAVAHVAARLGIASAELRVISNTTGDRATQRWDLPASLDRLRRLAAQLTAT
jgi:futalosine hydrolase